MCPERTPTCHRLVLLALALTACFGPTDYSGSRFLCEDGECPAGFTCVNGICVDQNFPPGCEVGIVIDPRDSLRSIGDTSEVLTLGNASVSLDCPILRTTEPVPDFYGPGDAVEIGALEFYVLGRTPANELVLDTSAFASDQAVQDFSGQTTIHRAFDNIPQWELLQEGDLVLRRKREIGIVYRDDGHRYEDAVEISGSQTSEDYYLELRGAIPHRGLKDEGVVIEGPIENGDLDGDAITCLSISDSYTKIRDLEFRGCGGNPGDAAVAVVGDSTLPQFVLLERLLVDGDGAADSNSVEAIGVRLSLAESVTLRNSFFYDLTRGVHVANDSSVQIDNITVSDCHGAVLGEQNTALDLRNVLALDCSDKCFDLGSGGGMQHCASSDNTAFGEQARTMIADSEVVDEGGSHDLHLSNSSTLRNAGFDLSEFFTEDIDGDTRSTWSIGGDE